MSLKKIFQVDVGWDKDEELYQAQIYSIVDKKLLVGSDKILRGLMTKVGKQIRKKEIDLRKFPLPEDQEQPPEPSRIILAGTNGN